MMRRSGLYKYAEIEDIDAQVNIVNNIEYYDKLQR